MSNPPDDRATLVLVDDDGDDAVMLREAAARGDLAVRIVHVDRGQKLLDGIVAGSLPERCVVLLDLNMPTMDGFAVLSRLRSLPAAGRPPVVVYSTSADQMQVDRAYAGGANAYVTKPGSLAQTVAVLTALLGHWFAHGRLPGWRLTQP